MNKKIFIALLITIACLFNINSVKAEEGYGKHGTKGTICQYCLGSDCYYVVGSASAPFAKNYDDPDRQLIYHNTGSKSIEQDTSWGDITAMYIIAPDGCETNRYDYFYVVHTKMTKCEITGNVISFLNPLVGLVGDLIDLEFTYYIAPNRDHSYENYLLFDNLICHEDETKREVREYRLKNYYGIDVPINDPSVADKIRDMKKLNDEAGINQGTDKGCAILNEPTKEKINWFLDLIKYGGAALAIILGATDFLKAVLSDEDNANKKAFERFVKRIIAAILLFLLPLIIQLLFTTLNNPIIEIPGFNVDSPTCGLGMSE